MCLNNLEFLVQYRMDILGSFNVLDGKLDEFIGGLQSEEKLKNEVYVLKNIRSMLSELRKSFQQTCDRLVFS